MTLVGHDIVWNGPSRDPADEQFGDVVESATLETADEFDAVLLGEPTDEAVIGRKGARFGPAMLREALAGVKTHHFDLGGVGSIGDLGDVRFAGSARGRQGIAEDVARQVHAVDTLPVFLGGDNSLTYPNVRPLLERGSVGVVNLDAHLDVREPHDGPTSGTPYRQLFEAGLDGYVCLGARHFETTAAYAEFVTERGGEVITAETVGDDPDAAAAAALEALGDVEQVYVSLDLDVLDASAAPGVSAPTPGGLTTRELFRVLRVLAADLRVVGFEVVECAPPLDEEGRTAEAGARAIAHFLVGALRGVSHA
jgi:formiminoglutamase